MSFGMLVFLVTVCALSGLASVHVRHRGAALSFAALSSTLAAASLAYLAATVMGVSHPDPVLALSFVLLTTVGGGLLFGELGHIARAHSGRAAVGLLTTAWSVGAAVYAIAA